MDKSHEDGDDQKTSSSNLTTQSRTLEMTRTEGVSSTSEGNIENSSSSTEESLKVLANAESSTSSEIGPLKLREQLLKIFGNTKPSTSFEMKTSSPKESLLKVMKRQTSASSSRICTLSISNEGLLNTLETGLENPSSSALEPSEVFEKETPSSSSDLNPTSSTEELSKIFENKTSEELQQVQENQIPSAKQLFKLYAKERTALLKEISSSSDNDKPLSSSDDISSVDENFSDRKETRTLPPFLKRNSRRSPELWKYTKPIPIRVSAVPAATTSETISSSAAKATSAQDQCAYSFASLNLDKNADIRKSVSKGKSPATKNEYSPNNRCSTCGADPGFSSPLTMIRYRNKRLLAARKGYLQSKMESQRSAVTGNIKNPQAETATQSKEMVTKQQEEDKNKKPKNTQQQINYEIMNQQVLDFFNRMQDYAEEDVQEPRPRAQQNQGDEEGDDIFEMEDIN